MDFKRILAGTPLFFLFPIVSQQSDQQTHENECDQQGDDAGDDPDPAVRFADGRIGGRACGL
jgi:hypothetical protein